METSIFLAKIFSLIYLSVAVGAFSSTVKYDKVLNDFLKSPALTYVTGFIALVMGMFMVEYHNIWVKDWPVLITIVGWLALLKGIFLIAFPNIISYSKPLFSWVKGFGVLTLGLGILFGYFGFFV